MSTTLRHAIGFLIDRLEGLLFHHDTTFALMGECHRRGHRVYCFEQSSLEYRSGDVSAEIRQVTFGSLPSQPFEVVDHARKSLSELDVLFMRKDPPADNEFIHATQMVELAKHPPFFINSPSGLRDANEKLLATHFLDLTPLTLVSRNLFEIRHFVDALGGRAIIKPLDGFAGLGVFELKRGDLNFDSIVQTSTLGGHRSVMVQAFLPASREGDKRVLLLEGKPIGALLRVPRHDDVRANLAAGASAVATSLTSRDLEICVRVAPMLIEKGLHFVGLDIIGECLTEINVTSPTGLVEINRLSQVRLEQQVIDFAEECVESR